MESNSGTHVRLQSRYAHYGAGCVRACSVDPLAAALGHAEASAVLAFDADPRGLVVLGVDKAGTLITAPGAGGDISS